jgi:hypothetical protein
MKDYLSLAFDKMGRRTLEKPQDELKVSALGVATAWLFERGFDESMGNMKDFGVALKSHLEKTSLGETLSNVANIELDTPSILMLKSSRPTLINQKSLNDQGITKMEISGIVDEIYEIKLHLPSIYLRLYGTIMGELEPMIQIARASDGRKLSILTSGDIHFEEPIGYQEAIKYGHILVSKQDELCKSIGSLIKIPGFGELKYCYHLPSFGIDDPYVWLPGISKSGNGYYLTEKGKPMEIKDRGIISKLDCLYKISTDPVLTYQNIPKDVAKRINLHLSQMTLNDI